eukprot:10725840-Lingulodinium_polyedra.AAC.1
MFWLLLDVLLEPPSSPVGIMAAVLAALAVDCYLRPSEALLLRASQVAPPVGAAAGRRWSLSIAPATGL